MIGAFVLSLKTPNVALVLVTYYTGVERLVMWYWILTGKDNMPYIKLGDRMAVDDGINKMSKALKTEGDFNYAICQLFGLFVGKRKLNYATVNAFIGVLECAKLEIYRRSIAEYEDGKIETNGDIPWPSG